jgi:hypothetical protein
MIRKHVSRLGAYAQQANNDTRETTAAARAASPGQLPYWERKVDPDGQLDPVERARRARAMQKLHFARMGLRSALARRKAGGAP